MYVCTLGRYYDRVYFRFRHLEFEPSGSAVAPNPTSFKNGVFGQNTCIEDILKSYKNSKNLLDVFIYRNCIQRYTKCVAFLELNGVKKKLSSLIMGHFQMRVFAVHATGVQEMYKRWETQIFHILLIWWTLRPLELDVQPMFCRFSSANELEHVWSIDAGLVSCFRGSQ